ncbi:GAF domain-containing protein [Primorskyibacter sp. S187A]|uniref:GAF domain-containing protein n=1 Tax=Primorskyibacter sp. S187A TaxID=3415130 RepID=UPI003C7C0D6A
MTADATFSALHAAADDACGARLFTVTVLDHAAGLARRAYSSHPEDYPVTGTKPMGANPWMEQVIGRGEVFVANETAGFSPYFSDHALINALGCEAAMNIPVSRDGRVVGTVNILDKPGHFTPARVATLTALVEKHRAALLEAFAQVSMG